MDDTKGLIFATVILTATVSFVDQATGRKPWTPRSYLGASFMGIFLIGIGMVNVRLARNFAILIMLSVLIRDKGHLFEFAGNASKASARRSPTYQTAGLGDFPQQRSTRLREPSPGRAPIVADDPQ